MIAKSFISNYPIYRLLILVFCIFVVGAQAGCQGCYGLGVTTVDGIVLDDDGHPIGNANVIIRGNPIDIGDVDHKADTDKDGKFTILLGHQPGLILHDVTISVKKDGYIDYSLKMETIDTHPRVILTKANNKN